MSAGDGPKGGQSTTNDDDSERELFEALKAKGMQKFYPALRDHGVCSVAMLADLEPSDTYSLGITAFQLKSLQKLVLEVDKKVDEKPFATTRVIIDGRGCLIGKGMNFSVTVFKKRLDGMLLKAGARAKHTKLECVAYFEQEPDPNHPKYNPYHPRTAVTEALKTVGIQFIDPGIKKGADDMAIKRILRDFADELNPSDACVVLIANDKDFADEIITLKARNIKTVLFHRAGHSSDAFLSLFDVVDGSWDNVRIESGLGEPSTSGSDDSGGEDNGAGGSNLTPALADIYHQIKMLLLGAPGRCIDGKDFRGKWRERYGTDLVLPGGVRLKAFLEGAEAAGACRLQMLPMPNGPASLMVRAPRQGESQSQAASLGATSAETVYKANDRVQAKWESTSHTWKNATVMSIPPEGDPFIWFDGFDDAKRIPWDRIRPLKPSTSQGLSAPQLPVLPPLPPDPDSEPVSVSVVKTKFEKALWLVQFEANRKKLALAKFYGVSVVHKGSSLEVFVRDPDDDEQVQAATELVAALKQVEANLNVSEPFSLPGAAIDKLWGDLDLKRLEREQRVLVIRPKKGADSASTDAPAGVRLVNDGSSDLARVQEYLSETYTSVEREVTLPDKLAHLSLDWLEQQIMQPAEARYQVKITLARSWKGPFEGGKGGKGSGGYYGKGEGGKGVYGKGGGKSGEGGKGNFTPALNEVDYKIKMLLLGAPGRCIDGKDFKGMWRERYGTDLALTPGVKLKTFLEGAEAAGACRLQMLPMPNGPASLMVRAPFEAEGGKGSGKGSGKGGFEAPVQATKSNTYRICGVPWRIACAIAAVEATEVRFLKKLNPELELVYELRKMRKDLLSSGDVDDDVSDDASTDSDKKSNGRLHVAVFAPLTPGVSPLFVKVTLAMAPPAGGGTEEAVGCAGANCPFLRHSAPPPLRFSYENALFCCSKCHQSSKDGAADATHKHGRECEQRLCGVVSSENGVGDYAALKAAHKSFQALLDTFGQTSFRIEAQFPKRDAHAALDALDEKLGGQGKVEFAKSCGLVKVEWDKYGGEAILIGVEGARKIGFKNLKDIGNGAKIETVRLSWPDERLFRGLFGFNAAQGAAALSRLHAAIATVELPSSTSVDYGTNANPAAYAVVRGASTHVAVAAKAVRTAVEAFVREHVTTAPVKGLAPDEEAYLVTPPRDLVAKIESIHSVVIDFSADDGLALAAGHGGGGSQKQQLLLEATGEAGTKVRVLHGDLLFSKCGAIVNAANGRLAHSGGVASVIAAAAGPAFDAECRKAVRDAGGMLATGVAVPTGAGGLLNARGTTVVVHAVVPEWNSRDHGNAAVLLMQQAVRAALAEAENAGAREVAIPLCGSGIYGWPASRAAKAVMGELVAYAANPATKLTCLNLVDFEAPKATAAADALSELCGAAPKAADATSPVQLPEHQWYFYCKELSKRDDGFQPYDYDQNQQVEAAWAAYSKGRGPSEVTIVGDAGGVKSNSTNIPQGKAAAEYTICFLPRIEDSCQMNVVTRYERKLKREKCTKPPPLFEARVAEAARVQGNSGGGRFRISHDGRGGSSLTQSGIGGGIGASVSVRGFTKDARAGASALVADLRASKRELELNLDEAETPAHKLLADLQEAASADGATVELVTGKQRAIVRAFDSRALKAAYGACAAVRDQARMNARAPPEGWVLSTQPAAGASFVLTSVNQGSIEWKNVADAVAKTMPAAKLTRLERVQNQSLWDDYAQRRSEVAKKSADGFSANEVRCFHGTRNFPVASVCELGLDFRHGNDGSMWGRALYIASNASYSNAYSSDGGNGERQFFYVRAALGRPKEVPSDNSIRAPPTGYDSVEGTTQGSRVHMLYNLNLAYPEYIVTYRRS